jgi:glycosyltransferase involved in cell wall biosynthesis
VLISIISHCYNNVPVLRHAVDSYRDLAAAYPGQFEFVLIDDHSAPPVDSTEVDGVPGLRLYRIAADVTWNMAAARNIGAKESRGDVLVLHDIDHTLRVPEAREVTALAADLSPTERIVFRRYTVGPDGVRTPIRTPMNNFMIRRSTFLEVGGYEEMFVGCYGYEDRFFKHCCAKQGHTWREGPPLELLESGYTRDLSRDLSRNKALFEWLVAREISRAQLTYLSSYALTFESGT